MPANTLTRKAYCRSDYAYIRAHYQDMTAAALAQQLGRTTGSLYEYISRHPELRKYGKT